LLTPFDVGALAADSLGAQGNLRTPAVATLGVCQIH
jgi:hypothetical protein